MNSIIFTILIYISFIFFDKHICYDNITHIINKYDYILFKFNFYNTNVMQYKISIMKNMLLTFICIIFIEMLIHNSYI